jgi:hypothetical protein
MTEPAITATPTDTAVEPIAPPPMDPAPTPLVADDAHGNPEANNLAASLEPVRGLLHKKCGKVTNLDQHRTHIGDVLIRHPGIFHNLPCDHCGGNHPATQFTWKDGKDLPAP